MACGANSSIAVFYQHSQNLSTMQFALLHHDTAGSALDRPDHWDFMIEIPGAAEHQALRTWALTSQLQAGATIQAVELPPHRLQYLSYEGPVSENRGCVRRVDRGSYELLSSDADSLVLHLAGSALVGQLRIDSKSDGTIFSLAPAK